MEDKDWYSIKNAATLDSPALVFYPERIRENIRRVTGSIDDISRLRPHVKTHKSEAVTLLMLESGISKFKCATIAEAEMLGNCKVPDVLLAYQPVGPKIQRFIQLVKTFPATRFSCIADNERSMHELSIAAIRTGIIISVYLDLNVGMNRTGIVPDTAAVNLYKKFSTAAGLALVGVHAYDGHIHEASIEARRAKWFPAWIAINRFKEQVTDEGLPEPVVVAGGTPTFPFYAAQEKVECSPGTFVLWDKGYGDAFTEQDYLSAAVVMTRVVSLTTSTKITVDLGHKAVAAENKLANRVFFLNAPDAVFVGQSEEHLVIALEEGHGFHVGDILYGIPIHICPTVALHERASTVFDHELTGEWPVSSRDRKITI